MKFYQENKINPLASCLPLLLQLPVFISLFYMLRTDLKKHICADALVKDYNARRLATTRRRPPHQRSLDCRQVHRKNDLQQGRTALGQVPVHPRHHDKATGVGAGRC